MDFLDCWIRYEFDLIGSTRPVRDRFEGRHIF